MREKKDVLFAFSRTQIDYAKFNDIIFDVPCEYADALNYSLNLTPSRLFQCKASIDWVIGTLCMTYLRKIELALRFMNAALKSVWHPPLTR